MNDTPSIFAPQAVQRRLPRRIAPLAAAPATLCTRVTHASANDALLLGILDSPLQPGETAREGFLRKESELRTALAALPTAAQRALVARLANAPTGDQLAERFGRLTPERRTRLLTFLANARRREALARTASR